MWQTLEWKALTYPEDYGKNQTIVQGSRIIFQHGEG